MRSRRRAAASPSFIQVDGTGRVLVLFWVVDFPFTHFAPFTVAAVAGLLQ
jgi:hypothetical protein